MHELVEKIVVHAPDKSSGHREQRVDIYFRFNVASATATLGHGNRGKKEKGCVGFLRNLFKNSEYFFTAPEFLSGEIFIQLQARRP